jgi:hypothetical protein
MILSKTPADHLDHLRMVFEKIREHGLQIRMSKCKFLQSQVKYLGHILSADVVAADPDRLGVSRHTQRCHAISRPCELFSQVHS